MHTHKIRLIDYTYDLDIAKQLLKKLIDAKIDFINDRMKETDANDKGEISDLKARINDLKAEERSLDLLIADYDGEHVEMEIGATIIMSIKSIEST